jgi:hypothetical protein
MARVLLLALGRKRMLEGLQHLFTDLLESQIPFLWFDRRGNASAVGLSLHTPMEQSWLRAVFYEAIHTGHAVDKIIR